MKTKLLDYWDSLRTSLWFIPTLMAIIAIVFAEFLVGFEREFLPDYQKLRTIFYAGDIAGARLLLSSMASSVITVAGVTFSITMVTLTLTTSQFGPRLLRNFMADRTNKSVLGMFVATFIFCLLVLRSIQENQGDIFVPRLAVSTSIVLVVVSFGVLIYFFHHVSTSIHAENVIEWVYSQLQASIDKNFPADQRELPEGDGEHQAGKMDFENKGSVVSAEKSGYLRALNEEMLLRIACENDLTIKVQYRPGNFVIARSPLVSFIPGREIDPETERKIHSAFILGTSRTPEQDVEFSIHQLVEVAVRALSPGINDPYTAISCIDRLGAALCLMNEREFWPPYRYDDQEKLRLILHVVTFKGVIDSSFNQIRQYGKGNVDIYIRILEALYMVALTTKDSQRLEAIRRHGNMVYRASRVEISEKEDQGDIDSRFQALKEHLNAE